MIKLWFSFVGGIIHIGMGGILLYFHIYRGIEIPTYITALYIMNGLLYSWQHDWLEKKS